MSTNFSYKTFNMVHELDVCGEFLYNGISGLISLTNIEETGPLFSALYNLAIGTERLQKIALVLWAVEDLEVLDNAEKFNKNLRTHNHLSLYNKLYNQINTHSKIWSLTTREQKFLKLLDDFYKNARYERFNPLRTCDYETRIMIEYKKSLLSANTDRDYECNSHCLSDQEKEILGRIAGGLVEKYYQIIIEGCTKNQCFSYEVRPDSKASKIFLGHYRKNSLKECIDNKRIALLEFLLFFRNVAENSEYLTFIDSIAPLELDLADIPDYIEAFLQERASQELIDTVETLYEELDNPKQIKDRLNLLEALTVPIHHFEFKEDQ